MTRLPVILAAAAALSAVLGAGAAPACTDILVTPGASADGSAVVTYNCDGEFHPHLRITPAADHAPGDSLRIDGPAGPVMIPQPAHTWAVAGLINERQVSIGESTFGGRAELRDPDGLFQYWTLMRLALQRAATAREAVAVITSLADRYGYRGPGESFSIADPHEVWLLELAGAGPGSGCAVWVARRVPDGMITAHANMARIGVVPRDDPDCLCSDNLERVAAAHGWYDPAAGRPLHFQRTFDPAGPAKRRTCAMRVWSIYRRAAPSRDWPDAYVRGEADAPELPLFVRPDRPLTLADVMALNRDHYEGTPFDMTRGLDAGPFGSPLRNRPLTWEVDGVRCAWERPISTQQTGFSMICQSRAGLPDPVGGVMWYGVDDTDATCWFPVWCGVTDVPPSFAAGSLQRFSRDSAWWVFNLVSNYAQLRYRDMIADIRAVQRELEGEFLARQPEVERIAVELYGLDPALARSYLTRTSVAWGERTAARWRELADDLLTRYNDGFVQEAPGRPRARGYPAAWYRAVLRARGDVLPLPAPPDTSVGRDY